MGQRVRHIKTIDNDQATIKVREIRAFTNVDDLCVMLGMSKKTMYKRMELGIWKINERYVIANLKIEHRLNND